MESLSNEGRYNYFNEFPELETERFYLKEFKDVYLNDLSEMVSDEETMKYSGMKVENVIEYAKEFMSRVESTYKIRQGLRWAILDKNTESFVGEIGFYNINLNGNFTELGYTIKKTCWRQGVATECINELSNFAFNKLGMDKISLMINDKNHKSINLAFKLNFKQENQLKNTSSSTMSIFSKLKKDTLN